MQLLTTLKRFNLYLIILLGITLLYKPIPLQTLAFSPSFSRQEILDPSDDLMDSSHYTKNDKSKIDRSLISKNKTYTDYNDKFSNINCTNLLTPFTSTDIRSVSYISDGKTLNATIWLNNEFLKEPPKKEDNVPSNLVSLNVQNLTIKNVSLDQYVNTTIIRYSNNSKFTHLREYIPINLRGIPAKKIVFDSQADDNSPPIRVMQIIALNNTQSYIITYTNNIENYNTYLPVVQKMIDSFKFVQYPSNYYQTYENPRYGVRMQYPNNLTEVQRAGYKKGNDTISWIFPKNTRIEDSPWKRIAYSMYIDVISTYDTGIDYLVNISWNTTSKTWTKEIVEVSNGYKILHSIDNDTSFFKNGKTYVELSFNLSDANYPEQYK